MTENIEYFETKTIKYNAGQESSQEYTILLQNENGPCPLVAIANTLILSNEKVAQKDGSVASLASFTAGKDKVSVNGILEQLGDLLVQKISDLDDNQPGSSTSGAVADSNGNEKADHALSLLPKLVTGLNINVRFNGTFEETPEMSLFRIYDVDIVHGWVCDLDDPEYSMITKVDNYDEAQSVLLRNEEQQPLEGEDLEELKAKAGAIKHFMESNSTQLTSYGLGQLRALLSSDSPSVFFRNDHFATIILRNNTLYTLVADQGYKDQVNIVWQSLTGTTGIEDAFYNGEFKSCEDQTEQDYASKPHDENDDYMMAKQLQMDADEQLAKELASENEARAQQQRSDRQQRQQRSRRSGAQQQQDKKKKKCIIM